MLSPTSKPQFHRAGLNTSAFVKGGAAALRLPLPSSKGSSQRSPTFHVMRIDEGQLAGLSATIASEHADLLRRMVRLVPSEPGAVKWWWSALDPRRGRALSAALDRTRERTSELLSRAIGVDVKAAELEMNALTLQLLYLWAEAHKWELKGLLNGATSAGRQPRADDTPAGFAPAVEALLGFYFGEARSTNTLVAETQLALLAMNQVSPLTLKRDARARRRRAYQRYAELWEAWAESSAASTSREP